MGFNDLRKFVRGEGGGSAVSIAGPTTTFGEILVAQATPVAQGDFVYGFNNQVFVTSSFSGASTATSASMAEVSSGTSVSGSSIVQLRRGLKYKPGEGSLLRATALFDTPAEGNEQYVGMGNTESGYFIGYSGSTFGILHTSTAATEIRELTITAVAAAAQDITITLDGASTVVNIDANSEPETAAFLISQEDFTQVGDSGWVVDAISSSVYFFSSRAKPTLTGTYSATGTGFTGAFSRTQAGLTPTSTFIPSGSFNIDKLDGTGPSGIILNPQKGNIYQIGFQYLGFGNAKFSVSNPETGNPVKFHEIKNANARTTPVLKNPNCAVLVTSANTGGTTSKTIKTVSMAAFTEGQVKRLDPKFAKSFQFTNVNESSYAPLALIKANRLHKGQRSFGEIDFLKIGGSNQDNNQTLTIGLFLRAEIEGSVNFVEVDSDNSVASYAALDPSNDVIVNEASITPFYEIVVGSNSAVLDNLDDLDYVVAAGEIVCLAIKTTTQISGQVSITWFEQQ